MTWNGSTDSDENDSLVLISPRRRDPVTTSGNKPPQGPNAHYDDLTNSLYSFSYSRNTGSLLSTRLIAMQRSATAADIATCTPTLPDILLLLQFLRKFIPPSWLPADLAAKLGDEMEPGSVEAEVDESTLRFLTLPYIDIVRPGEREPSLSLQRPPSMFRRASSMILTPQDTVVQGISTPLEHLRSKNMHMQAVLTTEAVHPFCIRTLNDIACLVCVTNQQTAPNRSILDFVAPQFRDWLQAKIDEDPAARVRLSGELVDLFIMGQPKMVSLWVECVNAERLVWTLQEVGVRKPPIPDANINVTNATATDASHRDVEPKMRHGINELHEIILSSPLGLREPNDVACAVALDRSSLTIRGYNRPTLYFMLGYRGKDLIGKPVTDVIPQFEEFWSEIKPFCTSVGVVIPEHKFRELVGIDLSSPEFVAPNPSSDPQRSIRALDKSGIFTFVDIQLRVVDLNTLVLWISYSRASGRSDPDNSMLNVPSQRTLLPEVISSLDSSPSPSSRSSSDDDVSEKQEFRTEAPQRSRNTNPLPSPASIIADPHLKGVEKQSEANPNSTATGSVDPNASETAQTASHSATDSLSVTLVGDSAGPSEDEVWDELSNIQVGSQRRTKSLQDFSVLKMLGEGAYGKVSLVRPKTGKFVLALKSIIKDRILVDTWSRDRKLGTIPNEIRILNQLRATRHPHIVDMVDFFEDSTCYHVELLPIGTPQGVDLFDFLEEKSGTTTQRELLGIWGQVVSALAHVHSLGIVHRDIKDENIVMDQRGNAKLIDFGSAAYLKQGPFDVFVGTVDYAAPEIVQGQTYEGCPQDSWALGILLYTIMYKETPFHGIEAIIEGKLPSELDCLGSSLIRRLLVKTPASRPTPARCLEFLKDMEIWNQPS